MIFWIFAAATALAAAFAAFDRDIRRAALALWVAGLGSGAVFMSLGAEALAILQWIVSTLIAISFVFFVAMLGEPAKNAPARRATRANRMRRAVRMTGALLTGAGFFAMVAIGAVHLSGHTDLAQAQSAAPPLDLAGLGHALSGPHVLSLELVALTLLFALVGGGIIARPEEAVRRASEDPSEEGSG